MNYIILFATGVIVKTNLKIIRTFISSLIGSIYAIISYVSKIEVFSNILLKVILSMVMIYIAYAAKTVKSFLKQLIIFYLTSFTFGGVALCFIYFVKPQNILINKRNTYWYISNKDYINCGRYGIYNNYYCI